MYFACIYVQHFQQIMDQPDMVANTARGQPGKMNFSLSSFATKILISRDWLSRPVPCQPTHSPHSG